MNIMISQNFKTITYIILLFNFVYAREFFQQPLFISKIVMWKIQGKGLKLFFVSILSITELVLKGLSHSILSYFEQ